MHPVSLIVVRSGCFCAFTLTDGITPRPAHACAVARTWGAYKAILKKPEKPERSRRLTFFRFRPKHGTGKTRKLVRWVTDDRWATKRETRIEIPGDHVSLEITRPAALWRGPL